ncbi:MAG: cupin domain-containing protein [Tabrizicola sp.]|nr:cupin domain-containing protein [Tabrizicola sp.]
MTRVPVIINRSDWALDDRLWRGNIQGQDFGVDVTVLFYATEEVGKGPRLHVHPYDEVFIIRTGRALFTIGDQKIEAEAGQILVGPAGLPHKFANLGPGILETIDIHLNPAWVQTNLDDPPETD